MEPAMLGLLGVALAGASSGWVLRDARAHRARGRPVVAVVLGATIEDPVTWAGLCLLAVVVFLPLYLAARRAAG